MTDRSRNALIGLFVLGGLTCLAVLIVLFGESRGLFQRRYVIKAKFSSERVPNIRAGTEVDVAGVWAGSVAKLELVNPERPSHGLFALLEIDDRFQVPKGSLANVIVPLMGQAVINIVPPGDSVEPIVFLPKDGTAEIHGQVSNPLENVIPPMLMATLEKTTRQLGELAEALTPAAKAVTNLLEPRPVAEIDAPGARARGLTANLSTAIERLHNVLLHIDMVLGDPEVQSNLKLTLEHFREAGNNARLAADGFRSLSADAQQAVKSAQVTMGKIDETVTITKTHVDELGAKLTESADKLSAILDQVLAASQQMNAGEGTVGMLLRDPKFYDELMLTTRRLGDAALELKVLIQQWQKQGLLGGAR